MPTPMLAFFRRGPRPGPAAYRDQLAALLAENAALRAELRGARATEAEPADQASDQASDQAPGWWGLYWPLVVWLAGIAAVYAALAPLALLLWSELCAGDSVAASRRWILAAMCYTWLSYAGAALAYAAARNWRGPSGSRRDLLIVAGRLVGPLWWPLASLVLPPALCYGVWRGARWALLSAVAGVKALLEEYRDTREEYREASRKPGGDR